MQAQPTQVALHDVGAERWDAALASDYPFLRHAFLDALERHGATTADTGWLPFHHRLGEEDSFLPLYLKGHSHGEFTYDWGWADALERAGGRYYPKLLCGVPFTPAAGPRLLGNKERLGDAAQALRQLAHALHLSSTHVAYPEADFRVALEEAGFLQRTHWQFHWHNRGYGCFDDFLGTLKPRKRKNIARERRRVLEQGISFRAMTGTQARPEDIDFAATMYARTFEHKGNWAVLPAAVFHHWARELGDQLVLILAEHPAHQRIGCAILFKDQKRLYGRYWGATVDIPFLHFETCYHQGIEYAIREGLERFEPGALGEHKIARGFHPVKVYTMHYFREPALHDAVAAQLEALASREAMVDLDALSPYREP